MKLDKLALPRMDENDLKNAVLFGSVKKAFTFDGKRFFHYVEARGRSTWIGYCTDPVPADTATGGKWILPVREEHATAVCLGLVLRGFISEAKTTRLPSCALCCLFSDASNLEENHSLLIFLRDENLLPKTKSGHLRDISFKLNSDTKAKRYGTASAPYMKLSHFLDLKTGKDIKT